MTVSRQLNLAGPLVRAGVPLSPGHHAFVVDNGSLTVDQFMEWAANRNTVVLHQGGSLWWTDPGPTETVQVYDVESEAQVTLPEGWVIPADFWLADPFRDVLEAQRDARYADYRDDSWQHWWWSWSDGMFGDAIRRVAAAWSTSVEGVLRLHEGRRVFETGTYRSSIGIDGIADVLVLRRPGVR